MSNTTTNKVAGPADLDPEAKRKFEQLNRSKDIVFTPQPFVENDQLEQLSKSRQEVIEAARAFSKEHFRS